MLSGRDAKGGSKGPPFVCAQSENGATVIETLEQRRYLAFGSVDTAWATSGRSIADVGLNGPTVTKLIPSGSRIYAAGRSAQGDSDAVIARFKLDGSLDTSFGDQGKTILPDVLVPDAIVGDDGNIYAAVGGHGDVQIVKLTASGRFDPTFGDSGVCHIPDSLNFSPAALAYAGGKILIAGGSYPDVGSKDEFTRIIRIRGNGQLDSTFGRHGTIDYFAGLKRASTPFRIDDVSAIRALSDGTIAVTGGSLAFFQIADPFADVIPGNIYLTSARFSSHGIFDPDYGTGGFARVKVSAGPLLPEDTKPPFSSFDDAERHGARHVGAIRDDGSVVMAGRGLRMAVTELNPDGSVNFTSSADGDFPLDLPTDIALLNDGRIVLSGLPTGFYQGHGPALAQVSPTGSIGPYLLTEDQDSSTPELAESSRDEIDANGQNILADTYDLEHPMAVLPDGKLVMGGMATGRNGFAIEKFDLGNISDPRTDLFPGATVSSLARDDNGGLHFAYYDSRTQSLRYAYRAINGRWSNATTIDSTAGAGQQLSLGLDASGNPSIAYYDAFHGDLRYARSTNGGKTWTTELVDSSGSTGLYPSLMIDTVNQTGQVSIAYYRKTSGDLRYAVRNSNGTWTTQNIDTTGDVGRYAQLYRAEFNGEPLTAVAYVDNTDHAIKLAKLGSNNLWTTETVTTLTADPTDLSIVFVGNDQPAIGFYDPSSADFKIAVLEAGPHAPPWRVVTTRSEGAVGFNSALTLFEEGGAEATNLQAYAYDRTHDRVLLMLRADNGYDDALVGVNNGGTYLSLARNKLHQVETGDAAFFDSTLGALRVGTVFNPINDSFTEGP